MEEEERNEISQVQHRQGKTEKKKHYLAGVSDNKTPSFWLPFFTVTKKDATYGASF